MKLKKTFKNLFFNMFYQLLNVFANLIMNPLIINHYGSLINGLISTVRQIIVYLDLVGGGISSATIQSLYRPLFEKDEQKINEVVTTSTKLFFKAGKVFLIILLITALVYPIVIGNEINYWIKLFLILITGISGVVEFFFIGRYRTLLIADQKLYIVNIAQSISIIFNLIITVLLVFLNNNVIIVQLGGTATFFIRVIILHKYVKKHYTYLNKSEKVNYEIIEKRWDAFAHVLTGVVINSSQAIILSTFCGLTAASIYSVYSIVFSGINMITTSFSNGLLATFGQIVASKDLRQTNETFEKYEFIYYLIVVILYGSTLLLILPFINIYIGNKNDAQYVDPIFAVLFVIVGVANNIRIPTNTVVSAAGHFKETKKPAIIEASINIVGQLVFVNIFGMYGVLLGSVCSYVYRTNQFILYTNKNILIRSSLKTYRRLIYNTILFFIGYNLLKNVVPVQMSGYIEFFFWGIITTLVFIILVSIGSIIFEWNIVKNYLKYFIDIIFKKGRQYD